MPKPTDWSLRTGKRRARTGLPGAGHPGHTRRSRLAGWASLQTLREAAAGLANAPAARAVAYGPDDRHALALLLLPFFIMAFALGTSQSLRTAGGLQDFVAWRSPAPPSVVDVRPRSPVLAPARTPVLATRAPVVAIALPALPDAPPRLPVAPPSMASDEAALSGGLLADPAPLRQRFAAPAPDAGSATPIRPGAEPRLALHAPNAAVTLEPVVPRPLVELSRDPVAVPRDVAVILAQPLELPRPGSAAIAALDPAQLVPPMVSGSTALGLPDRSFAIAMPHVAEAPRTGAPGAPQHAPAPGLCVVEPSRPPHYSSGGAPSSGPFGTRLAVAARAQTSTFVIYNDQYRRIAYPMGDVPALFGVCTDVVVRAYRALGVDLQALVQRSGLGSGDTSIDHRRVSTLRRFFAAHGEEVGVSDFAEDYLPGDIVTYDRPQNRHSRTHIAIVADQVGPSGRPMIVHNRGWGPQMEDALFVDRITGHYRFAGQGANPVPGTAVALVPEVARTRPVERLTGPLPSKGAAAAHTKAETVRRRAAVTSVSPATP